MMPVGGKRAEPAEVAPSSVAASACAPLSATHLHRTYPAIARTVLAKKLRSLDDSSLNQLLSKAAAAGGEGLTDGPQSDSAGEPQGAGGGQAAGDGQSGSPGGGGQCESAGGSMAAPGGLGGMKTLGGGMPMGGQLGQGGMPGMQGGPRARRLRGWG